MVAIYSYYSKQKGFIFGLSCVHKLLSWNEGLCVLLTDSANMHTFSLSSVGAFLASQRSNLAAFEDARQRRPEAPLTLILLSSPSLYSKGRGFVFWLFFSLLFFHLQDDSVLGSAQRRQFVYRGEQREEFNLKRNGIPAGEHSLSLCVSLPPRQTPLLAAEAPTGVPTVLVLK